MVGKKSQLHVKQDHDIGRKFESTASKSKIKGEREQNNLELWATSGCEPERFSISYDTSEWII
jgi:hypothetical protein